MTFYEKSTGYDGSKVWRKIHGAVQEIECDHCRNNGSKLMTFSHDVVNFKLGKSLFNPKNFTEMLEKLCSIKGDARRAFWATQKPKPCKGFERCNLK